MSAGVMTADVHTSGVVSWFVFVFVCWFVFVFVCWCVGVFVCWCVVGVRCVGCWLVAFDALVLLRCWLVA